MKKKFQEGGSIFDAIGKAGTIGLHMVSGILVGSLIGWFLDSWLDTNPWFLLFFFVIGVCAGFRNVWIDTCSILRAQEKPQRQPNNLSCSDKHETS